MVPHDLVGPYFLLYKDDHRVLQRYQIHRPRIVVVVVVVVVAVVVVVVVAVVDSSVVAVVVNDVFAAGFVVVDVHMMDPSRSKDDHHDHEQSVIYFHFLHYQILVFLLHLPSPIPFVAVFVCVFVFFLPRVDVVVFDVVVFVVLLLPVVPILIVADAEFVDIAAAVHDGLSYEDIVLR
jgi:hypothetical protein